MYILGTMMTRFSVTRPAGRRRYGSFSRGRSLLLASAALLSAFLPAALPVAAQTVQRIVTGKVVTKENQPVKNAVVYLKDDHTLSVKSFISDDNGGYRFGQLSQATDYELWAEVEGKKSGVKTISSFENKNAITINLKMDK